MIFFRIGTYETPKTPWWLIGCFGFNGPLRQYFSLFQAGRKKREKKDERTNVQTALTRIYCKRNRPLLDTIIQISRAPQHCKFTQHHGTARPPPKTYCNLMLLIRGYTYCHVLIVYFIIYLVCYHRPLWH